MFSRTGIRPRPGHDPSREAEREHGEGVRPARPAWTVQLGIGSGPPAVQVHVGGRHAAGNRCGAINRHGARRLLASPDLRTARLPRHTASPTSTCASSTAPCAGVRRTARSWTVEDRVSRPEDRPPTSVQGPAAAMRDPETAPAVATSGTGRSGDG
ncbi:DUF6233 domain-containing protein [Streptomyces massasporeus]|uniref:DUF6233 domain-containing protein n=1 Tax=Streptomyces massasporeus TaxID=67324 RepID=UPI003713363D